MPARFPSLRGPGYAVSLAGSKPDRGRWALAGPAGHQPITGLRPQRRAGPGVGSENRGRDPMRNHSAPFCMPCRDGRGSTARSSSAAGSTRIPWSRCGRDTGHGPRAIRFAVAGEPQQIQQGWQRARARYFWLKAGLPVPENDWDRKAAAWSGPPTGFRRRNPRTVSSCLPPGSRWLATTPGRTLLASIRSRSSTCSAKKTRMTTPPLNCPCRMEKKSFASR